MKKLLLLVHFILIISGFTKAQFDPVWMRKMPGEMSSVHGLNTVCDSWGNTYIGVRQYPYFIGSVSHIFRYDINGAVMGQFTFPSNFHLRAITINSQDQVIIAGSFSSTLQLGSQSFSAGQAYWDGFVGVFDGNLDLVWAETFGGAGGDAGMDVAVDGSDNIYVCGVISGNARIKNDTISCSQNGNAFLARFSPNGSLDWVKHDTGEGGSEATKVLVNENNEVLLTGITHFNPVIFDSLTLSPGPDMYGYTYYTAFLIKYSSSYTPEWGKAFDNLSNMTPPAVGFDTRNTLLSFIDSWQDDVSSDVGIYDNNGTLLRSLSCDYITGISTINDSIYILKQLDEEHYGYGVFYQHSVIAKLRDTSIVTLDTCKGHPMAFDLTRNINGGYMLSGSFTEVLWFDADTITADTHGDGYNEVYPFLVKLGESGPTYMPDHSLAGSDLHLYPVPAKDELNIYYKPAGTSDVSMRIIDPLGKVMFVRTYSLNGAAINEKLPLPRCAPGIYFVELVAGSIRETRKVIVQ